MTDPGLFDRSKLCGSHNRVSLVPVVALQLCLDMCGRPSHMLLLKKINKQKQKAQENR